MKLIVKTLDNATKSEAHLRGGARGTERSGGTGIFSCRSRGKF